MEQTFHLYSTWNNTDLLKGSVRILREVLYKILFIYFLNEEIKAQISSNLFMVTKL